MDYFYNHTIRNLVIAMQTLFKDIVIKRYDDNGEVVKEIPVPLKFGPLHKYQMQRLEDGSMKRYYIQLPTMALTIGGFTYSQNRARSTKERRFLLDPEGGRKDEEGTISPEKFLSDMMPAPWDINFTLHIRTESFMDFTQIVEQIIPFFHPSVYLRLKEFNTVNLERDIRVTLSSMNPQFSEEQEEDTVRTIDGTLDFTADAWFYKPLTDADMIRKIHTNYGYNRDSNVFVYNQELDEGGFIKITGRNIESFTTEAFTLSEIETMDIPSTHTTGPLNVSRTNVVDDNDQEEYGYIQGPKEIENE